MTKEDRVLEHLKTGKTITSIEAINLYGATRLAAIIYTLKKKGYFFDTTTKTGSDRYGNETVFAEYKLKEKDEQIPQHQDGGGQYLFRI